MNPLIADAARLLRDAGYPVHAAAVRELAERADSLTLEVDVAVEMARGIANDTRALLDGAERADTPR